MYGDAKTHMPHDFSVNTSNEQNGMNVCGVNGGRAAQFVRTAVPVLLEKGRRQIHAGHQFEVVLGWCLMGEVRRSVVHLYVFHHRPNISGLGYFSSFATPQNGLRAVMRRLR